MTTLTVPVAAELVSHEAIVQEWYKDSVGVGTWGIGVTDASGHRVGRYKDNPQTIERVLEVFVWLVRTRYLPDVVRVFGDRKLTEPQLAAALSFHYNTGAIDKASWVRSFLAGNPVTARTQFMEWRRPAAIIERREKECRLFFDGVWSGDGTALVIPVNKPSYTPNFRKAKRVNILADLERAMAG